MQSEKCKKQLIIIFITVNVIVKNKSKKNYDYAGKCSKESLSQFNKSWAAVDIIVKTCNVVKQNPKYRYQEQAKVIPGGKFYWNIYAKPLRFYYCLAVNKKYGPTNGCSQKIQNQVLNNLPFSIHYMPLKIGLGLPLIAFACN